MSNYFVKSGTGGADTGADWANAAESIAGLMTAQAIAGGDNIYVHVTHSYLAGAAITWTLPETGTGLCRVICVDGGDATGTSLSGTTVGATTSGALESTNGNFNFTINSSDNIAAELFVQGMTIQAGSNSGQASANIIIQATNVAGSVRFLNCTLHINSTSVTPKITNGGGDSCNHSFENCIFQFGNASQAFNMQQTYVRMLNCSLAGTSPTSLFVPTAKAGFVDCFGCDFTNTTNILTVSNAAASGKYFLSNCALGDTTPTTGTHAGPGGLTIELQGCAPADGTNGADILSYYYEDAYGVVESIQTIYKATGGAQGEQDDGTDTSYSFKIDPTSYCTKSTPLYTPWIYVLVGSTGDKTITLKVAHTESAVLTTSEVWMETQYMGEPGATGTQRVANSPHAFMEVDDNCNVVSGTVIRDTEAAGSNRTDDAADDWTGLTSEKEHTLTASVNCAEVGYIRCRVGLGKNTTNAVYVDPKIGVA